MHRDLEVNNIISLDQESGDKISSICGKLGVAHNIIPIDPGDTKSLKHLFKNNINKLLKDKITFVHCLHGRDRTGLFVAMVRCLLDKWDCKTAIKEAKKLRFGVGLDLPVELFYMKLICRLGAHNTDANDLRDIRNNIVDLNHEYRDYNIEAIYPLSWAPYAGRTYPDVDLYRHHEGTYPTREDFKLKDITYMDQQQKPRTIPQVGIADFNTQITNYVGPSIIGGGFV